MGNVIFVGNGINRAFNGDSWESLIENIYKKFTPEYKYEEIKDLPFPLQIVAASADNVNKAMGDVVKELPKVSLTDEQILLLKDILSLPTETIITANYSFELEQASGIVPRLYDYRKYRYNTLIIPAKSNKLRIDRYYNIENYGKKIWHIHGDICSKTSIIMGHYYYEKLVKEIEEYIPIFMRRYKALSKKNIPYTPKSWVDSFLIDDVYMFGFGMNFSESDIWWLLCCKKRNFPDSKVYFYSPEKDIGNEQKIMLKAYNVKIVSDVEFDNSYKSYYKNVVKDIKTKIENGEKNNG